jgi:hypothetical protein
MAASSGACSGLGRRLIAVDVFLTFNVTAEAEAQEQEQEQEQELL